MEAKVKFEASETASEQVLRWRKILVILIHRAVVKGKRMPLGLPPQKLPRLIFVHNLWGKHAVVFLPTTKVAELFAALNFRTNPTTHRENVKEMVENTSGEYDCLLMLYSHPMGSQAPPLWEMSTLTLTPDSLRGVQDRKLVYACYDSVVRSGTATLTDTGTEYVEVVESGHIDTDLFRISEAELKSFEANYRAAGIGFTDVSVDTATKMTSEDSGTQSTAEDPKTSESQVLRGIIQQLQAQKEEMRKELTSLEEDIIAIKATEEERFSIWKQEADKDLETKRQGLKKREVIAETAVADARKEVTEMKKTVRRATEEHAEEEDKRKKVEEENKVLKRREEEKNKLHNRAVEKITRERDELDEKYHANILKHDKALSDQARGLTTSVQNLQAAVDKERRRTSELSKLVASLKDSEVILTSTRNDERTTWIRKMQQVQKTAAEEQLVLQMRNVFYAMRYAKFQSGVKGKIHD